MMSKGYQPPDYGRGKSKNLKDRVLEPDKQRQAYESRRDRAVELHIKNSPTKKLLDWFFAIALFSVLIQFICVMAGVDGRLGIVNKIPQVFLAPVKLFWHYGDKTPVAHLGQFAIPLPHIIMMVVYGTLYPLLSAVHGAISENRTYMPE